MDKRALTSAENGKKGGRPKGYAALEAEKAREYIIARVAEELEPIVSKAIDQAKEGDKSARDWLTDRAFGKAIQITEISGKDGEPLFNEYHKQQAQKALEDVIGE